MKYLTHGGIAQISRRKSILRLRNLLRCSPTGHPHRLSGHTLRNSLTLHANRNKEEGKAHKELSCLSHRGRYTMNSEFGLRFKRTARISLWSISRAACPKVVFPAFSLLLLRIDNLRHSRGARFPGATSGHFHCRSGSPEHDGSAWHQSSSARAKRRRESAQPCQLRRIQGQSIPHSS